MSFIYKQERSQEDSWGTQNTVHLTQLIIIIIIIRQKHAYHFNTCISMNTQNKKYNTVVNKNQSSRLYVYKLFCIGYLSY